MAREEYADRTSDVEVTFIDGSIKNYRISVGPTISPFLARQAGETGILTLLNGGVTHNIPVTQIREYEIRAVAGGPPSEPTKS